MRRPHQAQVWAPPCSNVLIKKFTDKQEKGKKTRERMRDPRRKRRKNRVEPLTQEQMPQD